MISKKINSILLINPQNTIAADSIRRIAIPLGLLYIGAALKGNGFKVTIIDSTCEGYFNTAENNGYITYGLSEKELFEKIKAVSPDLVGIQSMFSAHQENALAVSRMVKRINPAVPVVLGGVHPSLEPEKTLFNDSVDFVIMGEGETRLPRLLSMLNQGKVEFDFDGIAYKHCGKIIVNPMENRISDLDSIPFPAWDLIDMEKYIVIGIPYAPFARRDRVSHVMTSRGCPFNCVFCSTVNFWGRKFRARSVKNIIQEIDVLVNKYGINEIQFMDDNMTIDRNRAMELFSCLKRYNLVWCTPHGIMAKTLDKEMIELMADSGAYQLAIGIESASRRVLQEIIHKSVPEKEEIKELIRVCHENKIQMHGLFSLGYPGETKEEIMETLQYPFDTGFDSVSFFIANPMPGSELQTLCQKKGYLPENGLKMDVKSAEIVIPEDSPDFVISRKELVDLVDKKTHEFNEFSKKRNPKAWEEKFQFFLRKYSNQEELIKGRVT
ncbi:MAG: cobalamin-dependent protein [Candidatus Riflebacteria bacterium]|nr:cobalamin-dependent protein [Candidatus Riflebacteria bacterium]